MLLEGKIYSRKEYLHAISEEIFGIQKDILRDQYAPNVDYADIFMAKSNNGAFIYLLCTVPNNDFFGKLTGSKRFLVLKTLTKEEYGQI